MSHRRYAPKRNDATAEELADRYVRLVGEARTLELRAANADPFARITLYEQRIKTVKDALETYDTLLWEIDTLCGLEHAEKARSLLAATIVRAKAAREEPDAGQIVSEQAPRGEILSDIAAAS